MDKSSVTDSQFVWSITLPTGTESSVILPHTVKTFEDFIKVDIYTGDSDPVYWAIARARKEWGQEWATRFCVAMCAYYHTGTACKAADLEGEAFWRYLKEIYPGAPRASERRHFRGEKGLKALTAMQNFCLNPSVWFDRFPPTYIGVRQQCERELQQFGPYFQLKVCDYITCLGRTITSWVGLERNLPTEPADAIRHLCPEDPPNIAFLKLVGSVRGKGIMAPPYFDHEVGPSEVETSLCGWLTSKYRGNWFGADIQDKRDALKGHGATAEKFMTFMPPVPNKYLFKLEL